VAATRDTEAGVQGIVVMDGDAIIAQVMARIKGGAEQSYRTQERHTRTPKSEVPRLASIHLIPTLRNVSTIGMHATLVGLTWPTGTCLTRATIVSRRTTSHTRGPTRRCF
jgi:hypothetical protein